MTARSRRHLEVEDIGAVTVVNFTDRRILDEQDVQVIGNQLFSLVDDLGRKRMLLNFGNVEFMSSTALGKLITLNSKMGRVGGLLVLCHLDPAIREVFEITKLDKLFKIRSDEEEGLKAFSSDQPGRKRGTLRRPKVSPRSSVVRVEGAMKEISREAILRNQTLRREAIEQRGLRCEVCGFSFGECYGPLGEGYIEVHHLRALSERKGKATEVTVKDVRNLCANCHRMVHREGAKPIPLEKLRRAVQKQRSKQQHQA
jgi:anti-sigma B factor antagonist